MNTNDQRSRRDDDDRPQIPPPYPPQLHHGPAHDIPGNGLPVSMSSASRQPLRADPRPSPDVVRPEFTLLVAGCRGGKTSFLRLLLDTTDVSPNASRDQLASVAKFVQGCSGHTSYIRPASVDLDVDLDGTGGHKQLALTLVDTPSLDFLDPAFTERVVSDIMRHIDSRFAEGVEDEWKGQKGHRFVHLCIYFLDPDRIVPPSVPAPPAPLIPRARTNSFSQPEQEPVILEPPVTMNPLHLRPTLPLAEIKTIRRLSARVNVLPVIARADLLSNDRLAAVKLAIRRDLADAGIGFGIFDVDSHYQHGQDDLPTSKTAESSNGYAAHPNGSSSATNSPPTSPVTPSLLRLPYALISPDLYSHSDGVPRKPLSRHELIQQYTPSPHYPSASKIIRGKFIRSYRWGSMDVLDPNHCDFLPLRAAIFHHMETLQNYTKDYLFDKFASDYRSQRPSPIHGMPHRVTQGLPPVASLSHASRPILAIDTAPQLATNRHPSLSAPRDLLGGELHSPSISRPIPDPMSAQLSARGPAPRSTKQRTKKITVACNFCRSRKLKCDGGRPACSQCVKRSNSCDYMPQNKRRGTVRQRKGDESDSESGERSEQPNDTSLSPQVPSQSLSRRSSNVDKPNHDGFVAPLPPIGTLGERREESAPVPSSSRSKPNHPPMEARSFFPDNELPHIATLSLPEHSPSTPVPMSAPSLPPIRPASEQQAQQRRRSATVPGKGPRQPSSSGPKVVACNFCRARKTKCDGAHPACASCARRQLPCNYVHDSGPSSSNSPVPKKSRRASTSKAPEDSPHSTSPPSSRYLHTPSTVHDGPDIREVDIHLEGEVDLKRSLDHHPDTNRPPKKMRMESPTALAGIP